MPGGPTFESLRSVRGILTPADGSTTHEVDALFTNDTATLVFDVVFPGTSQRYSLTLAATDTAGDTLFTSSRDITATPGTTRTIHETLRYVGADTAVVFLGLMTSDTAVLAGDSIVVIAQGYDAGAIVSVYLSTSYPTPVTLTLSAADGTVRLGTSTLVFEPGVTRLDVQLHGAQPGTTTITATDIDKLWTPASVIVVVSDGAK